PVRKRPAVISGPRKLYADCEGDGVLCLPEAGDKSCPGLSRSRRIDRRNSGLKPRERPPMSAVVDDFELLAPAPPTLRSASGVLRSADYLDRLKAGWDVAASGLISPIVQFGWSRACVPTML